MALASANTFWSAIQKEHDGCWIWMRAIDQNGSGRIRVNGSTTHAHLHAWRLLGNALPVGTFLRRRCENRRCVNPDHMLLSAEIQREPYRATRERRLWNRVEKTATCWIWRGSKNGPGNYGYVSWGGKVTMVHRLIYALFHGPIPTGLQVCHHCDNPPCVNPSHLFLGTMRDNMLDRQAKGRGFVAFGEENASSKLTHSQVKTIRRMYDEGVPIRELAHQFGVGKFTIQSVVTHTTWREASVDPTGILVQHNMTPHSLEISRNANGGISFTVKVYAASPEEALAKAKEHFAKLDAEFPPARK